MNLSRLSARSVLVISAVCAFIPISYAGKVKTLSLDKITQSAAYIFEGTCTQIKTGKDDVSGMPATWYTFEVLRPIKGKFDNTFTFKQLGGEDSSRSLTVPLTRYEKDEHLILFLYPESKIGFTSSVGMNQGKFNIQKTTQTGKPYVTNGMPGMTLFQNLPQFPQAVTPQGQAVTGMRQFRSPHFEKEAFIDIVEQLIRQQQLEKN